MSHLLKRGFIASSVIFLCAVVLLVTHAQTGLTVSTIGVCIAAATLIAAGKEGPGLLKKIDYQTLLFFIGLFVVVEARADWCLEDSCRYH